MENPGILGIKRYGFNFKLTIVIRVSPATGILKANESKVCKVTFCPKFIPKIYDLDLYCEITDKNCMVNFLNFILGRIFGKERNRRENSEGDFGHGWWSHLM